MIPGNFSCCNSHFIPFEIPHLRYTSGVISALLTMSLLWPEEWLKLYQRGSPLPTSHHQRCHGSNCSKQSCSFKREKKILHNSILLPKGASNPHLTRHRAFPCRIQQALCVLTIVLPLLSPSGIRITIFTGFQGKIIKPVYSKFFTKCLLTSGNNFQCYIGSEDNNFCHEKSGKLLLTIPDLGGFACTWRKPFQLCY